MLSRRYKVCNPPTLFLSYYFGAVFTTILLDKGSYHRFCDTMQSQRSESAVLTFGLNGKQRGIPRNVCLPCVSSNFPLRAITQSLSGTDMLAIGLTVSCECTR